MKTDKMKLEELELMKEQIEREMAAQNYAHKITEEAKIRDKFQNVLMRLYQGHFYEQNLPKDKQKEAIEFCSKSIYHKVHEFAWDISNFSDISDCMGEELKKFMYNNDFSDIVNENDSK